MTSPITDERLKEILDGCEGVQGGPWKLDAFGCYIWAPSEKGGDFPIADDIAKKGRVLELRGWGYYTGNGHGALGLSPDEAKARQKLTGNHIARLDPATVAAIASELLAAREALSAEDAARHLTEVAQALWDRVEARRVKSSEAVTPAEQDDAAMAYGFDKAAESIRAMIAARALGEAK